MVMPVIPDVQEAEIGGSRLEASPGQKSETSSENKLKQKGHDSSSRVLAYKALSSKSSTAKKQTKKVFKVTI
jgi:hypothetical protein